MRLSKIQVVIATLFCLLVSGSAHAQFGKIKALAEEKLNRQENRQADKLNKKVDEKTDQKVDQMTGQNKGNQGLPTGSFGEAKVSFAPGVKKGKPVEVARQHGATPEVRSSTRSTSTASSTSGTLVANVPALENGRSQEVSINISRGDARQIESVRAYSPCAKIKDVQVLSATQMKATIDLTGNKSGGTCALSFVSGGNTISSTNVAIRSKK